MNEKRSPRSPRTTDTSGLPAAHVWKTHDLADLMLMDEVGPQQFRTRFNESNSNGRTFGGQLLAQAVAAAARTVPKDRPLTNLQFMFLQGTLNDEMLDLTVTSLQDGKRFSARHVRGSQSNNRITFDALTSFAGAIDDAPDHETPLHPDLLKGEMPENLPTLSELPVRWSSMITNALHYPAHAHASIDMRFASLPQSVELHLPNEPDGLCRPGPNDGHFRYWLKLQQPLADDHHVHAAAFAYLSDWWLNYASTGPHVQGLVANTSGLYVASLNHVIWMHRSLRADEWLHFDATSPSASHGRGLSVSKVHDRTGRLVATVTQECLMAPRAG